MADLRSTWKETGKGLGGAFKDLGKTLIRTAKVGAQKADAWANSEDEKETAPEAEKETEEE